MSQAFGQAATPLSVIRGIIHRYPYSFGQISELIQNSEDAVALKQVCTIPYSQEMKINDICSEAFAMDHRRHPTTSLYHQQLAPTQGPALLAYNDAEFDDGDWHALQYAHESSKADDLSYVFGITSRIFCLTCFPRSKIGKFGVGFRSLFHVWFTSVLYLPGPLTYRTSRSQIVPRSSLPIA